MLVPIERVHAHAPFPSTTPFHSPLPFPERAVSSACMQVLRSEVEAAQSESEAKARELKESEAALATAKAEGEQVRKPPLSPSLGLPSSPSLAPCLLTPRLTDGTQSEAALGTAREELAASEVYRAELRAECERLRASAAAASEAIDKAAKLELALAQVIAFSSPSHRVLIASSLGSDCPRLSCRSLR